MSITKGYHYIVILSSTSGWSKSIDGYQMLCAIYSHICCSLPTNAKLTTIEPHEIYDSVLILIVYVYVLTWKATYYSLFSMLWSMLLFATLQATPSWKPKSRQQQYEIVIGGDVSFLVADITWRRRQNSVLSHSVPSDSLYLDSCCLRVSPVTKRVRTCHTGLNPCHDQDSNVGFRGHNAEY